jgi:hypothetical protein
MRSRRTTAAQAGAIAVLVGIVIVVVIVLIIVDVASTPSPPTTPPPQETCTLVHHIVLPDACVCSTAGKSCHPTKTRPYLIFFQQAAECPTLGCDVRLGSR